MILFYPRTIQILLIRRLQLHLIYSKSSLTKLIIYDLLGRKVRIAVNEEMKAGSYKVNFDGSNLSSGIYFYSLITSEFTETREMIFLN